MNRKHMAISGLWKYQISLLVHGQVKGQNPFVHQKFTCPKIGIFSYFFKKAYVFGTH